MPCVQRAEIILCSDEPTNYVFEHKEFTGEQAISQGYQYFKDVYDERADWLVRASALRENDILKAVVTLRIGPIPRWSKEYLRANNLGKYALDSGKTREISV